MLIFPQRPFPFIVSRHLLVDLGKVRLASFNTYTEGHFCIEFHALGKSGEVFPCPSYDKSDTPLILYPVNCQRLSTLVQC